VRRKNSALRKAIDNCAVVWWLVGLDDESKRRLELKDQPFKKG